MLLDHFWFAGIRSVVLKIHYSAAVEKRQWGNYATGSSLP
jgi:hypothetical protein